MNHEKVLDGNFQSYVVASMIVAFKCVLDFDQLV